MLYKKSSVAAMSAFILMITIDSALTKVEGICPKRPSREKAVKQNRHRQLFYVDAMNGNDLWSGTVPSRNDDGDGPFKTLDVAVTRIRQYRSRASVPQRATLYVRQGTYCINKGIILDVRDSNLWIVGYPGDSRPVISGAQKIPGSTFYAFGQRIYAARFNGTCSKHAFLGQKRLIRSRKPNLNKWRGKEFTGQGPYLTIKGLLFPTKLCDMRGSGGFKQRGCLKGNRYGFIFGDDDIDPKWSNPQTGEILIFDSWTAERRSIRSVGEGNRLYFTQPLRSPIGRHPFSSGWRYIVENIFEELDQTGEFFCDEDNGIMYLIPPSGALEVEDVYIGSIDTIFRVRGAKNIRFSDLDFRYSHDRNFAGYNPRPGILDFEETNNIIVDRCSFSNVGYTAIHAVSCINVRILENKFYDIGYIAVSIGYRNDPTNPMATRNVLIKKNTFEGCGVVTMLQPSCILVKGIGNINVTSNEISRSSYAGIRAGWQRTFSSDFVPEGKYIFHIERNDIHNYGMGILSDFAGVYLSSNPGCGAASRNLAMCHLHAYVAHNTIHDSSAYRYGAMGVYGDTAVASITVEKNWIYDLEHTAINFHCGQNNFALNNMIYHTPASRVFGACNAAVGSGELPRQILTFKRNVIYVANNRSRMFGRSDVWENDVPEVNNNIYYFHPFNREQVKEFFPKYRSIVAWRKQTKNDLNSRIVDPQFRDIRRNDFRLKFRNVVSRLGIKSIDLRQVRRRSGIC